MKKSLLGLPFLLLALVPFACSPSNTASDDDDGGSGNGGSGGGSTGVTKACEDTCIPQFPAAEANYRSLRECLLCYACYDVCTGELGAGLCEVDGNPVGSESPQACSAASTSCGECINNSCAIEQLGDTTFMGVCAGQGSACSNDIQCVSLNNCVANCVTTSGSGATTTGAGGGMGTGGSGGGI